MTHAATLLLALLLCACGGGSDDAQRCPGVGDRPLRSDGTCPDPIGPPDCRARPEVCQ